MGCFSKKLTQCDRVRIGTFYLLLFFLKTFLRYRTKGFLVPLCYYCYVHADAAQCTFHVSTLFFLNSIAYIWIYCYITRTDRRKTFVIGASPPRVETICLRGRNASNSLENNKFNVNNWLRSVLWLVAIEKHVLKEYIVSLAGFDIEIQTKLNFFI